MSKGNRMSPMRRGAMLGVAGIALATTAKKAVVKTPQGPPRKAKPYSLAHVRASGQTPAVAHYKRQVMAARAMRRAIRWMNNHPNFKTEDVPTHIHEKMQLLKEVA